MCDDEGNPRVARKCKHCSRSVCCVTSLKTEGERERGGGQMSPSCSPQLLFHSFHTLWSCYPPSLFRLLLCDCAPCFQSVLSAVVKSSQCLQLSAAALRSPSPSPKSPESRTSNTSQSGFCCGFCKSGLLYTRVNERRRPTGLVWSCSSTPSKHALEPNYWSFPGTASLLGACVCKEHSPCEKVRYFVCLDASSFSSNVTCKIEINKWTCILT